MKCSLNKNSEPHFVFYKSLPNDIHAVQNEIRSICPDNTGLLWLGSDQVQDVALDAARFESMKIPVKGTIQEMQSGKLQNKMYYFVSSWYENTGLTILDSNLHVVKQFAAFDHARLLDQRNISGVAVDKYQRLWISTLSGIYILNKNFELVYRIDAEMHAPDTLTRSKTNAVFIHNDTVWIACYKKGIDLFGLNFKRLAHFEKADANGLRDEFIWKISSDQKNNVWLCGNSVLYQFIPSSASFKSYLLTVENTGCRPHDFSERPDGSLLVASERGLIEFDPSTGKFFYIVSPLLKQEENILSVVSDNEGNAWYLTEEHLVFYDFRKKIFSLFGKEDGIDPKKGFSIIRHLNNKLFIPLAGQLISFHSPILNRPIPPPVVFINRIQVNDSLVSSRPISLFELRHDQNRLQFEFTGINYYKADQNQYAYYLLGIDKDWIYGNRNFVSYANLSPGNYAFHVKAANYAGDWGKEQVVRILIHPPFWRTWWFTSLAMLVIGSLFILIVRYVAQRNLRERILVLQKEQAVEKERNRIARDMHDDLGSGLTKIAILSEVAKKQLETPEKAS